MKSKKIDKMSLHFTNSEVIKKVQRKLENIFINGKNRENGVAFYELKFKKYQRKLENR